MKTIRPVALAAVVFTLLVTLSGCFGIPGITNSGGGGTTTADAGLSGTTWGGTDSDGDAWVLEFQPDNTVGLTFGGNSFDDTTDTWAVAGGVLNVTVVFDDGTATLTGPVSDGAASINLNGTQGDATWTLPLTKQ